MTRESKERQPVGWFHADRLWWEQHFDREHFLRWHTLLGIPYTVEGE